MRFFSQFPKVPYSFDEFTPTIDTSVIDIYRYVDVNRDITSDLAAYLTYSIKDGERPDQVSHKLYKTPDYHWTFFIINELLKDGIQNWPKSYVELNTYLNKTYGSYSVLEFLPKQEINENGVLTDYNNHFGQLEFDGRMKILRETSDNVELLAEPVLYDAEKLQLWVKGAGRNFLTNDDATYSFIYEGSESQKLKWAAEYGLTWCKESYPRIYESILAENDIIDDDIRPFFRGNVEIEETEYVFNNPSDEWEDGFIDTDVTNDAFEESFSFSRLEKTENDFASEPVFIGLDDGEEIYGQSTLEILQEILLDISTPWIEKPQEGINSGADDQHKSQWYPYGTSALGSFFMETYLNQIKFRTKRSYIDAVNAPQSYADSNDTRINTYDALRADINNSNYTTYYEYENNENEAKRDIVVLRESAVEPFAERYEELLNE
tara:strand:- start:2836 stop:4140 length:1305 start_codon:yes stop_codon:yes gene_type:complete